MDREKAEDLCKEIYNEFDKAKPQLNTADVFRDILKDNPEEIQQIFSKKDDIYVQEKNSD